MSTVTALYPGTFDPVTNGHTDVVRRAAALFDLLIVAIYEGSQKSVTFTVQQRVDMFQEAIDKSANVEVMTFSGLTVDFARQTGAKAIVRGLRITSDFEYEGAMALMNRHLDDDIETVCLFSSIENQYVSSSRVKEIAALGGEISGLVPPNVVAPTNAKLAPVPN
ncbi:MAG: pantetheine-phosphate adenylyltransferase [Chloroflexi bacterium]|nr:pantetheine-phosphate adenylyltransferase [Chloroflexota bacterium]